MFVRMKFSVWPVISGFGLGIFCARDIQLEVAMPLALSCIRGVSVA